MEVGLGRLGELFEETLRRRDWGDARQMRLERIDLGSAGPCPVDADPQLLETALLSLLGNAAKYSPRGSTILVRLARAGETVEVTVANV